MELSKLKSYTETVEIVLDEFYEGEDVKVIIREPKPEELSIFNDELNDKGEAVALKNLFSKLITEHGFTQAGKKCSNKDVTEALFMKIDVFKEIGEVIGKIVEKKSRMKETSEE